MELFEAKQKLSEYAKPSEEYKVAIDLQSWRKTPYYTLYLSRRETYSHFWSNISFEDAFNQLDEMMRIQQGDIWDLI